VVLTVARVRAVGQGSYFKKHTMPERRATIGGRRSIFVVVEFWLIALIHVQLSNYRTVRQSSLEHMRHQDVRKNDNR
jgi:hypothetical protein